jgi:DUF1680 family protein
MRLTREWKRGDRVEVDVDLTVRFTPGGKSYPNYVAVERGPLVLALDKGASPNIADLNQAALKTLPEQLTAQKPGLYALPGVVTGQRPRPRRHAASRSVCRGPRIPHLAAATRRRARPWPLGLGLRRAVTGPPPSR